MSIIYISFFAYILIFIFVFIYIQNLTLNQIPDTINANEVNTMRPCMNVSRLHLINLFYPGIIRG